jgi:hypothetical protein
MENKKNGLLDLSKKTASVFAAAFALLTGTEAKASTNVNNSEDISPRAFNIGEIGKIKTMPILKLNIGNPANSRFVANHESHASHSSHDSHSSHSSHYSSSS